MKRILTIQDVSCVGKCSLTVALPIISAMGVEAAVMPTAVLSTHTMFRNYTFRDLTGDMEAIANHWKNEKIGFDAIYTGYLGSFEQLKIVSGIFKEFRTDKNLVIVDPCMADNGKLYPGFTPDFAKEMAKLCGRADIIMPNLTEASFMLGIPYAGDTYDEAYIRKLLVDLSKLGAKNTVLKGITYKPGKLGVISYNAETKSYTEYFHERLPVSFHGTGDIFASAATGALMRGLSLEKALALAADYTLAAMKATMADGRSNWYGVNFESAIPMLVKRVETEAHN